MNDDDTKCFHEDCHETFSGDDKPDGWVCLRSVPPSHFAPLFYCPQHGKAIKQASYAQMLSERPAQGNAYGGGGVFVTTCVLRTAMGGRASINALKFRFCGKKSFGGKK